MAGFLEGLDDDIAAARALARQRDEAAEAATRAAWEVVDAHAARVAPLFAAAAAELQRREVPTQPVTTTARILQVWRLSASIDSFRASLVLTPAGDVPVFISEWTTTNTNKIGTVIEHHARVLDPPSRLHPPAGHPVVTPDGRPGIVLVHPSMESQNQRIVALEDWLRAALVTLLTPTG